MAIQFDDYVIESLDTSRGSCLFTFLDDNRSRLEDYFAGTLARTGSLTETIDYCQEIARRVADKSYFPFVICHQSGGPYVGFLDVKNIDWSIPKAEIGYCIDRRHEGKGITSRAFGLLVDHVVEHHGFKKLLCRVSPDNLGSIRVVTGNQFDLEGTIRRDYVTTRGKVVDLNYYGRVF